MRLHKEILKDVFKKCKMNNKKNNFVLSSTEILIFVIIFLLGVFGITIRALHEHQYGINPFQENYYNKSSKLSTAPVTSFFLLIH